MLFVVSASLRPPSALSSTAPLDRVRLLANSLTDLPSIRPRAGSDSGAVDGNDEPGDGGNKFVSKRTRSSGAVEAITPTATETRQETQTARRATPGGHSPTANTLSPPSTTSSPEQPQSAAPVTPARRRSSVAVEDNSLTSNPFNDGSAAAAVQGATSPASDNSTPATVDVAQPSAFGGSTECSRSIRTVINACSTDSHALLRCDEVRIFASVILWCGVVRIFVTLCGEVRGPKFLRILRCGALRF